MATKYPKQLPNGKWLINKGGQTLEAVHSIDVCTAPCTLHYPTDHHMRDFKLHWRNDRCMFERICEHGIGHPDPDDVYMRDEGHWVHGCDGCCSSPVQDCR